MNKYGIYNEAKFSIITLLMVLVLFFHVVKLTVGIRMF